MDYAHVSLISQSVWLSLSLEQRAKLVKLFGLKRSGIVITNIGPEGGIVQSDGYMPQDLMPITIAQMQEFLRSDSNDFYKLFHEIVENVDALLDGTFHIVQSVHVEEMVTKEDEIIPGEVKIIKKRGRPSKK